MAPAVLQPHVRQVWEPRLIHKRGFGQGINDDSLDRVGEIRGELLMIWAAKIRISPRGGHERIHAALEDAGTRFSGSR